MQSLGPIQITEPDILSINDALRQLYQRIDSLTGLQGRVLLYDRMQVSNPTAATDAVNQQSLLTQPLGAANLTLTGQAIGDLLIADTTTSYTRLADVAAGAYLRSGGVALKPLWSTLTLPNAATLGDLLYASATNVISALLDAADGNVLRSGGVGIAPLYGKVRLSGATVDVTGILLTALGGTGIAFFTAAGPTVARVYTFPDAAATMLYSGGALGTPASGVATNLTGAAAGLTAGTVTTNANLTGPVTSVGNATTIGAAVVTAAMLAASAKLTIVEKTGDGVTNYTTASATYVDIDATNLKYTVTIPTGSNLAVTAFITVQNSLLNSACGFAIYDSAVVAETIDEFVAGIRNQQVLTTVIVGDGASHTVTAQWKTSAGTSTISGGSTTFRPRMLFIMAASN